MLAASREIVLAEGVDALTIRRVAKAIGYCGGSIYSYFDSREAIAMELVHEGFERLGEFMARSSDVADPVERLRAIGRAYLAFASEEPAWFRLIFMNQAKLSDELMGAALERHGFRIYEFLVGVVRAMLDAHNLTSVDPEEVAQLCWSTLHGVASLRLTMPAFPFVDAEILMDRSTSAMLCRLGIERPLEPSQSEARI
jgi:AcrR family transcriptional regulator